MPGDLTSFMLKLEANSDVDEDERIDLARRLRKELLALNDVATVENASTPSPSRTKAAGIDWQTLIVTLAASGGVLTTLVGAIQGFLTRRERASVTLEIGGDKLVITGVSSETQQRLVNDWISRRAR
jgi:hypothetical protein